MVLQQIDQLRAFGCKKIYKDKAVKATAKKRPGLSAVRNALRPGDTFVVTAIDRAFRSTIDAINFLDDVLNKRGIRFQSLRERVDTSTPDGRKWYITAAAEAECERSKISIRTREAMAAQMRRGRKFGRPRKMTKGKIALARAAISKGGTIPKTARRLCVSPRTLRRGLSAVGKVPQRFSITTVRG
jgi:DNA invertase Pin-like site-specific DNA recombinase